MKTLTIFVISAIWFAGCASFEHSGVTIDKAETLRIFSIGSHNKVTEGRTDIVLSVPVEGVPVRLDAGGNGFLTRKNISIDEVDSVEYFEVLSRNEDVPIDLSTIPKEFFEYQQFQDERISP